MTRRSRLESKLQKRLQWADSREASATQKINEAVNMTKVIPMGQPILVGHHSEKGHRRLLEKSDNKMRSGIEDHDMAQHHKLKAAGLEAQLDSTIFSDDEDEVDRLEAKIAELNAERERWKAYNTSCRKGAPNLDLLDAHQRADIESVARVCAYSLGKNGQCPSYKLQNLGANIRRYEQRLEAAKSRQNRTQQAEQATGGIVVTQRHGWNLITFAEKPERSVLNDLKSAGYRWRNGSWQGTSEIPQSVKDLQSG